MNYELIPKIRLEIDGLKAHVMQMLGVRGSELGEAIDSAIEHAFEDYNLYSTVKELTNQALDRELQSYFESGEGKKMIQDAIRKTIAEVMNSGFGEK